MEKHNIIPRAPVTRILLQAGARRVSAEAVDACAGILQEAAVEIGKRAALIARHAGRKTVQGGDVKLAVKQ